MVEHVVALDRIPERHPDVSKKDAEDAWEACLVSAPSLDKDPDRYVGIGIDGHGRLLELVAVRTTDEVGDIVWVVIHAQTPPKKDIMRRLGVGR